MVSGQRIRVAEGFVRSDVASVAKQFAERLHPRTSGAKALIETKGFIAALKNAAPPKIRSFSNCKAMVDFGELTARPEVAPFQNRDD
jgi:hypothetical protein